MLYLWLSRSLNGCFIFNVGNHIGLIVISVVVGLFTVSNKPHEVKFKEAAGWSIFYIGIALGFGAWIWNYFGSVLGAEYFAANAFALLGLRALYFLLKGLLDKLIYLSLGLSIILMFIGVKLILTYLHVIFVNIPKIPTIGSLIVIAGVLLVSTVASLLKSKKDPSAKAHAGRITKPKQETNI